MTVHRVLADIVDALRTSHLEHETIRAEMATKQDLAALEAATKQDLAALQAETKQDLAALKAETKQDLAALKAETKQDLAALQAATKQDLTALRAETKHDLATLQAATKQDLAALETVMKSEFTVVNKRLGKLGLEFEAFRHDSKITLDMLSELMARTGRHEKDVAALDRRVCRMENHLRLKPLPNAGDQ